ncbi:MAG: hypothetical protein HUJ98_10130, partial [Bacteroidaceae bacterium]|nr:hypothetical protein [Bacteroidaceae bacterium]
YMPPYTSWMQVELEAELCGSVDMKNTDTTGIDDHGFGTNTHSETVGTETTNGIINYEVNQTSWQ